MRSAVAFTSLLVLSLSPACGGDPQAPAAADPWPVSTPVPTAPVATQAGASAAPAAPPTPAAGRAAPPVTQTPTSPAPTAAGAAAPALPPTTPAVGGSAAPAVDPTGAAGESLWCGVKRTLDANCVACHNEQKTAGAPMSLKTYADMQAAAISDATKKVYQVVGTRVHDTARPMPPQKKLTAAELTGIDNWVAAGAPAGADPTCAGSAPATGEDDGWKWPDHCDATYKVLSHGSGGADSPYVVPGSQELHPQVSVQAPWGNEEVQMIAWRAVTDNAKVLHHWILYSSARENIVGWAPGKDHNAPLPEDVGMRLPTGTMTLDMHYNNLQSASEQSDRSGLEICVLKQGNLRPKTAAVYGGFTQFLINIPPHAVGHEVTGTCNVTAREPVFLLTTSPHAHTYANHMKFTVQRASGETVMLHEGAFSFEEQGLYALDKPVPLNTGDKVITTCTFTNPTNATVTFGEDTGNEMCFNFALYYPIGALSCGRGGLGGLPSSGF